LIYTSRSNFKASLVIGLLCLSLLSQHVQLVPEIPVQVVTSSCEVICPCDAEVNEATAELSVTSEQPAQEDECPLDCPDCQCAKVQLACLLVPEVNAADRSRFVSQLFDYSQPMPTGSSLGIFRPPRPQILI
jgi:hypothetical protein